MDTPNLFDTLFGAMHDAVQSPYAFAVLVFLAVIGVLVLLENSRGPRRLDPTRHLEQQPTIEHKPPSLPPAEDFVKWEATQDKQKQGVPWEEN
jgi:hypothetical protein